MKNFLLGISLLFLSVFSSAQNTTTITGTLTDSDSQTWNYATWSAKLIVPGGGSPHYIGGGTAPTSFTGTLSSAGVFSGSVGNNAAIIPYGTQWQFTICSLTSAQCQTIRPFTIQGSTQNVGSYLSGFISAPRIHPASNDGKPLFVAAYNTTELVDPVQSSQYINTVSLLQYLWNATWTPISGGGGGLTGQTVGQIPVANSATTSNTSIALTTSTQPQIVTGTYNSTLSQILAGVGNGTPTASTCAGTGAGGDTNTIFGLNNLPSNTGTTRETTIFGYGNAPAYQGYHGTNPTNCVENGLLIGGGDDNLSVLTANDASGTTANTNTDIVFWGQKICLTCTTVARSVLLGTHIITGGINSTGCVVAGGFTIEGLNAICGNSQVLGISNFLNNTGPSVQNSQVFGLSAARQIDTMTNSVSIGDSSSYGQTSTIGSNTISNSLNVGGSSALNVHTETYSLAMGIGALAGSTTIANCNGMGSFAGQNLSSCNESVMEGYNSGGNGTSTQSVMVGAYAAYHANSPNQITALGWRVAESYTGSGNLDAIGARACDVLVSGNGNLCIGNLAGTGIIGGNFNVALGASSGINGTGIGSESGNTLIGVLAQVSPGVSNSAQIGQGVNPNSNTAQYLNHTFADSTGALYDAAIGSSTNVLCTTTGGKLTNSGCTYTPSAGSTITTGTLGTNVTSITCYSVNCSSTRGQLSVSISTSTTAEQLFIITFSTPYSSTPVCSVFQGQGSTWFGIYPNSVTSSGISISNNNTIGTAQSFLVQYQCQP